MSPADRLRAAQSEPVACYACPGRFQLARRAGAAPKALHSRPYCEPFVAVETVVDATRFAERCEAEAERRREAATRLASEQLERISDVPSESERAP